MPDLRHRVDIPFEPTGRRGAGCAESRVMNGISAGSLSRRSFLAQAAALAAAGSLARPALGGTGQGIPPVDATFLFVADVHACRMASGLSPNCQQEGKTDAALLRSVAALNAIGEKDWPAEINGIGTGLRSAGSRIGTPLGLVVGGDMTDDGGGQVTQPSEGTQLLQFSQRYQQGVGPDRVHMPVYVGLGNHDLDQNGPPQHVDWYRREMRDYVEINHRAGVFFKPPVPATSYDVDTDCYSWDWGGLHLVQTHRFAGDAGHGAVSSLPWLERDLATYAADRRPVILYQHYGWDVFSTERWNAAKSTFDDDGTGPPHWWSEADRQALLAALKGYNVVGIFHGHQHETPMIYRRDGLDLFKPKAAYMGGFALARVTSDSMDVVLGEATGDNGEVAFTNAFSKRLSF
ncbi:MAG: twin-arginine translocation signal domain-containing protein [Mesorhizobium sp.]|nr:twin-arginine translocation signal domain-containing protein [Mesorhizobium sp. M5C.F.Ca.IN.020.32.2.1]RWG44588.1 MAG: twin-arginine translocation signal domain-containing protein [Mesorhizobium sp.]RWH50400.1 MAG: twin-arginine translocation signal domain-containing protein [Mesorhizobium sp.]RWH50712.1 MAG: twin-arginine translocation signal domain-containing protein [Mesorhizobium sp.]RWI67510.1 MAG: twin-arginine translocation signal domain-containing protein [Mesorhizobium sp.]